MIETLPRTLAAAHPPAWKLLVAAVGCIALVFAATYITRMEKRLPLIYYKRRLRVRSLLSALELPVTVLSAISPEEGKHSSMLARVAVASCIELVCAATCIMRMEKRLPLIHYKRRLRVRALASPIALEPHSLIHKPHLCCGSWCSISKACD